MNELNADRLRLLDDLDKAVGQLRAEYFNDQQVITSFTRPSYWAELTGFKPTLLVGGRGTGKTTALRGMTYLGQRASYGDNITDWDVVGVYWRIDSAASAAFSGRGLDEDAWIRAFSHYANLKLASLFLAFVHWREQELGEGTDFQPGAIQQAATSLGFEHVSTATDLRSRISLELASVESRINGPVSGLADISGSVIGLPPRYLFDGIAESDKVASVVFAFLIDEYENLLPYQQRIINSLVKHVGDSRFTVKIGLRAIEARETRTLAPNQNLQEPADYRSVDIVRRVKGEAFGDFAATVCHKRFGFSGNEHLIGKRVQDLFPELTLEREAELLGADKSRLLIKRRLADQGCTHAEMQAFEEMSLLSASMVGYWARSQNEDELSVLRNALADKAGWKVRLGNYGYAMLFTIRRGKRGIRKYYAGWSTFVTLADGNIRLLLSLVHESMRLQVNATDEPLSPVKPANQTKAGIHVGGVALRELHGSSTIGGKLTQLCLSLGRIFNVLAIEPEGSTPEVNQIHIDGQVAAADKEAFDKLILEALANQLLVSFPSNKQAAVSSQTKAPDYQLHPIYSPFFVFSHRRKRITDFSADTILKLSTDDASATIARFLGGRKRRSAELPEQLELFEDYI